MYDEYLTYPKAISINDADLIYTALIDMAAKGDEILRELCNDFISACLRYADIRASWGCLSREQKIERDSARTSAHDRVIDAHNILFRYMTKLALSTEWYQLLGYDESDKLSRKRIGDFACFIALFSGLDAR